MATSIAGEIILIFSIMFIAITISTLWFAFSASKLKHKKELLEKKMDIIEIRIFKIFILTSLFQDFINSYSFL